MVLLWQNMHVQVVFALYYIGHSSDDTTAWFLDFMAFWACSQGFFWSLGILNPVSSLIAPVPVLTKDFQDLDLSV